MCRTARAGGAGTSGPDEEALRRDRGRRRLRLGGLKSSSSAMYIHFPLPADDSLCGRGRGRGLDVFASTSTSSSLRPRAAHDGLYPSCSPRLAPHQRTTASETDRREECVHEIYIVKSQNPRKPPLLLLLFLLASLPGVTLHDDTTAVLLLCSFVEHL